jgi:glutamyl-Q tRNA(Asp) synthetase
LPAASPTPTGEAGRGRREGSLPYRGRFAPTPSGDLHFGSLVAAVGSYLDARAHHGEWLLRIEDLDPPREQPGAAGRILALLDALGLHWDGPVLLQSSRSEAYEAALEALARLDLIRRCPCSRSVLAALPQNLGRPTGDELFHPAQCVPGGYELAGGMTLRQRVPDREITFTDRALGQIATNLATSCGDFVLRRRDGLYAYQLAVVVDDAWQGITDVVRGADLLGSTPRQVLLQQVLGLPTPAYLHLPLAVDDRGRKLSKSEDAPAARPGAPGAAIVAVLDFLQLRPPGELAEAGSEEALRWGVAHWRPAAFAGLRERRV